MDSVTQIVLDMLEMSLEILESNKSLLGNAMVIALLTNNVFGVIRRDVWGNNLTGFHAEKDCWIKAGRKDNLSGSELFVSDMPCLESFQYVNELEGKWRIAREIFTKRGGKHTPASEIKCNADEFRSMEQGEEREIVFEPFGNCVIKRKQANHFEILSIGGALNRTCSVIDFNDNWNSFIYTSGCAQLIIERGISTVYIVADSYDYPYCEKYLQKNGVQVTNLDKQFHNHSIDVSDKFLKNSLNATVTSDTLAKESILTLGISGLRTIKSISTPSLKTNAEKRLAVITNVIKSKTRYFKSRSVA